MWTLFILISFNLWEGSQSFTIAKENISKYEIQRRSTLIKEYPSEEFVTSHRNCSPNTPCYVNKRSIDENIEEESASFSSPTPYEFIIQRKTQNKFNTPKFFIPIINNPDANLNVDVNKIPKQKTSIIPNITPDRNQVPDIYRTPDMIYPKVTETTKNPNFNRPRTKTTISDYFDDSNTFQTFIDKFVPISLIKTTQTIIRRKTTTASTPIFFIPIVNNPLPESPNQYGTFFNNMYGNEYGGRSPTDEEYLNEEGDVYFVNNPNNKFPSQSTPYFIGFTTINYPSNFITTTRPSITNPPWWSSSVLPWWPPPVTSFNPWYTETMTTQRTVIITTTRIPTIEFSEETDFFLPFKTVTLPKDVVPKTSKTTTVSDIPNLIYPFFPVYPYPPAIYVRSTMTKAPITSRYRTTQSVEVTTTSDTSTEFFIRFTRVTIPTDVIIKKRPNNLSDKSHHTTTQSSKTKSTIKSIKTKTTRKHVTNKLKATTENTNSSTIFIKFFNKQSTKKHSNKNMTKSKSSIKKTTHIHFSIIKNNNETK